MPQRAVAACPDAAAISASPQQLASATDDAEISAAAAATGVAQYVATDFSAEMIRISTAKPAPPNLRFLLAEADALPEDILASCATGGNALHTRACMQQLPPRFGV